MTRLTKKATVTIEQRRIASLTIPHDQLFKIIFSHQVSKRYRFNSIGYNRKTQVAVSEGDKMLLYSRLGSFIDKVSKMSISEVEKKYKRQSDTHDATFDPEYETKVEVEHYCTYTKDENSRSNADSLRLHGYMRSGYFVLTRIDWHHDFHS